MAAADAGTSAGETTGDVKRPFDFSVSDFATIVTTTAFVDKSLMIRDVYNASSRILVTAPPRFGKSTNLDMVKRFFEIEVDARGIAKPVQTTNNYKLFEDHNLEIFKDIDFVKEHFGKHPVVHINFKPLDHVDKSAKILDALKMIIKHSLNQHNYILKYFLKEQVFSEIAGFEEDDFRKYVAGITKDLDEVNLANSFNHLSTILNRVFKKRVFVLIDSYDAFLESPLFENNTDREKIMSFLESSIGQLLNNVNCVDRVLITGVIPVIGEGLLCRGTNIEFYHFLDSHPFTKYYGLTSAEVDMVLSKVIECEDERRDVRNTINEYYEAYVTRNRDIRVYNVWSVLQYVSRRTVQSYWCDRRCIDKFKKFFKGSLIRQWLQQLLLGYVTILHISQPLSMTDVLKVNTNTRGEDGDLSEIEKELFVVLLYHFGYLSVSSELGRGATRVKITNEEIKYEIAKAVFHENRKLYSSRDMNGILSALDAFQPDTTDLDQHCESFRKSLYNFFRGGTFPFTETLEFLYMNLVTDEKYSRVMGRPHGKNSRTVVLKNENQIAICITCDRDRTAKLLHQEVANDCFEKYIFNGFNDVRGKVIIAIDSNGRIAYSYYFKTGDNLQVVRTLPNICTQ